MYLHEAHESAYCVLGGEEVEMFTGDRLEDREIVRPGDYWFIPTRVPRIAVNRGARPAVFIGVRQEPTAKESQIMRPKLNPLVR